MGAESRLIPSALSTESCGSQGSPRKLCIFQEFLENSHQQFQRKAAKGWLSRAYQEVPMNHISPHARQSCFQRIMASLSLLPSKLGANDSHWPTLSWRIFWKFQKKLLKRMVVQQQGVCRLPLMSHLFMIQRLVNNTITFFLSKYRCVCEDHRPEVVNQTVTVDCVFCFCLFLAHRVSFWVAFCFLVELIFTKWKIAHISVDF